MKEQGKRELGIVTEIGVFGNLNIQDPTVKKVQSRVDGETEVDIDEIVKKIKEEQSKNSIKTK